MCRVICPRHGSAFDLRRPADRCRCPRSSRSHTYPVTVEDGIVKVEVLDV